MKCIFSVQLDNGEYECGAFGTNADFNHIKCDGLKDRDCCPLWWRVN